MGNGLPGHHGAHIGSAGGVSDHRRAAADEGNGLVTRHLQALHQAQRHKMTHMERIRRRVEANIEGRLAVVDHLTDLFFICHLGDQAAGNEFVINFHFLSSIKLKPSAP